MVARHDRGVNVVDLAGRSPDLDTSVSMVQPSPSRRTPLRRWPGTFMLTGAKLGDILGQAGAAFRGIGLRRLVRGLARSSTALSPNITVLPGSGGSVDRRASGAVLVHPGGSPSLTAGELHRAGEGRALAFRRLLGGPWRGAGAAGRPADRAGFVTTAADLARGLPRAETAVVVVILLLFVRKIHDEPTPFPSRTLDYVRRRRSVRARPRAGRSSGILKDSAVWGALQTRSAH